MAFLSKTVSKKHSRRAIAALALLQGRKTMNGRAGRPMALVHMGDPIVCVDYSPQTVSVGSLFWMGIDCGANLHQWLKCARHLRIRIKVRGISARF